MRLGLMSLLCAIGLSAGAAAINRLPEDCGQCLVVTTASWTATEGSLAAFERDTQGLWHRRGNAVPLRTGKAGLAWGAGLLPDPALPGPHKVERDNRAPAGVFRLGSVFGYAPEKPLTKMRYLPLSHNILGIDDAHSRYYNQLVDTSRTPHPDWRSAENMILADDRYKWGIVVEHNVPPKPGAGSCIFLHVWKNSQTATTGCTALPESALLDIIRWLDPARHPLLIQLPVPAYEKLRARWSLPPTSSQEAFFGSGIGFQPMSSPRRQDADAPPFQARAKEFTLAAVEAGGSSGPCYRDRPMSIPTNQRLFPAGAGPR